MFTGLLDFLFSHIYVKGFPYSFKPFDSVFNPLPSETFQSGVFSPYWRPNLARWIFDTTRNALSNFGGAGYFNGINTVNGVTTVTANIGGRPYTAQLPPNSVVSINSNYRHYNGQQSDEVTIVVNGDATVYRTMNGRTIATDGYGNIRRDGGPLRIY
uniref:Tail fiber protein n=1 Tax=Angiostrongylus cantonensis TaxID=6313 RepID=A0A0K0DQZ7_ANGCA